MDKSFKRYRLITEDEEDKDRRKFKDIRDYDPLIWARVRIDKEIESVLGNAGLPPDTKLRMINSLILLDKEKLKSNVEQGLAAGVQQVNNPVAVQIGQQQPPQGIMVQQPNVAGHAGPQVIQLPLQQQLQQQQAEIADVSYGFPKYVKGKSEKLLGYLKDNHPGAITVSNQNELIINNNIVPESNIVDILNFMYNPGKKNLPPGYTSFLSSLSTLKVNPEVVSNQRIKKFLIKSQLRKSREEPAELFDTSSMFGKGRKKKIHGYVFRRNIPHKNFPVKKLSHGKGKRSLSNRSYLNSLNLYKL